MAHLNSELTLGMPQYTLSYGMRLDKGTAPELAHTHVSIIPAEWIGRKHGFARH